MIDWTVERIVHFEPGEFVRDGVAHFGFHAGGRYYGIAHWRHYLGLVGDDGAVRWTAAAQPVLDGIPNVPVDLHMPTHVDQLPDGALVVGSSGNARLYRIDPETMTARVLVDGRVHGLADLGNCVVDDSGSIWVNEIRGCRVWRFDLQGRPVETLGDGSPGFQRDAVEFKAASFGWIYDLRRGPDGNLYVLDSTNFAVRRIDVEARVVSTLAGNGTPGYAGDGADAREATFGSDPTAPFDGPYALALDEAGNAYIGDRFNQVVRMIEGDTGLISTIAGRVEAGDVGPDGGTDTGERDPLRVNLPMISSLDYHGGRLFVPTDLADGSGDLVILRRV